MSKRNDSEVDAVAQRVKLSHITSASPMAANCSTYDPASHQCTWKSNAVCTPAPTWNPWWKLVDLPCNNCTRKNDVQGQHLLLNLHQDTFFNLSGYVYVEANPCTPNASQIFLLIQTVIVKFKKSFNFLKKKSY